MPVGRRSSSAKRVRGGSMATSPSSSPPCLTIDSNILIAICSKEAGRHVLAHAELTSYATRGYEFYAPGYIAGECLYVLCRKLEVDRSITPAEHAAAVADLSTYLRMILPPPNGEASLVARAEQMRSGFGCSRSADGLFIALAEELTASRTTELLTFDTGIPNQVRRNAPTVSVRLLPTVMAGAVVAPPAPTFPTTPPTP
jgi:predicted nucleic acid-binding protein